MGLLFAHQNVRRGASFGHVGRLLGAGDVVGQPGGAQRGRRESRVSGAQGLRWRCGKGARRGKLGGDAWGIYL